MKTCGTVIRYFGGVQVERSFGTDYEKIFLGLIRWLLPLTVCLLAAGIWLERRNKMELLARYRYGTDTRWWRVRFFRGIRFGIGEGAILFCIALAADGISPEGISPETGRVFLLWFAHFMTMLSFLMTLELMGMKGQATGALLLLEGFSFLAGILLVRLSAWMYGSWGMYFQSAWYDRETGVPVWGVLVAEGVLAAVSYGAGRFFLKLKRAGGT